MEKGTNRTPRENRSTTVRMVVNPRDSGKSVIKSTAMWDQGLSGTGNGMSLPAGSALGVLHWEQTEHEETKVCMSLSIDTQQ